MDDAVLLVRQGDVSEFCDLLNANFKGDVGGYMEAACQILRDVVGNREVALIADDGRLESIVAFTRPRLAPRRFAESFSFVKTDSIKRNLAGLKMHWHFKGQDEESIFYSASCTYRALAGRYLDGADFACKNTRQVLDLDFGGVLSLVHAFEQSDETGWLEIVRIWMKRGENNLHKIAPVQIDALANAMYHAAADSAHPRKEILKMYQYQERFTNWRGYLALVRR